MPPESTPHEQHAEPHAEPPAAGPSYGASPYAGSVGPPGQPGQPAGMLGRGGSLLPGWAWPALALLALVVGALGGVLGGVAVSTSMGSGTSSVPVIDTDNGAAAPLRAENGSVVAVAARVLPSTVQILANGGAGGAGSGAATGSGFVLDDKGHVVTNNHVVAGATDSGELQVVDENKRTYDATIVGRSKVYDLAVLEVDSSRLRPASIGSSQILRVGDTVVAIGSPLGLSSTVTSGIVSATERPVTAGDGGDASYINALQTDAAINPGNSGGPLVNLRGQVVGVNSAIATTGGALGGASGNIGVGFAIPMEQVRVTAAQILATGKARYPVIGADVNTGVSTSGAEIRSVPSGSPAAAGGLREGDVVTSVDDKPVTDGISLIVAIRSHQPGETVDITVKRGARDRTVRVTLDAVVG